MAMITYLEQGPTDTRCPTHQRATWQNAVCADPGDDSLHAALVGGDLRPSSARFEVSPNAMEAQKSAARFRPGRIVKLAASVLLVALLVPTIMFILLGVCFAQELVCRVVGGRKGHPVIGWFGHFTGYAHRPRTGSPDRAVPHDRCKTRFSFMHILP